MFTLTGVCGMQCESVTDGTLARMTAMMTGRPSLPMASGSRFKAHAPRTDASGQATVHTASDDRFEVIFLGERYDVPAGMNHARHLLEALRQWQRPDQSATTSATGAAGTTVPDSPHLDSSIPDFPASGSTATAGKTGGFPPVLPDAFLNQTDGIFIAVIHDHRHQHVHFISDRLGLRYLYFFRQSGRLWWATETKALLRCPGFSTELSRDALDDFFRFDFIRGDKTMLRDAELMPAGTVRTYDIREDRTTDRIYWQWNNGRRDAPDRRNTPNLHDGPDLRADTGHRAAQNDPDAAGISVAMPPAEIDETAGHLAGLFRDAVAKRLPGSVRTGLGISGGLDSRAILAALPDPADAYLFTFGRRNSLDVTIAQRVSRLAGTDCDFIEIHQDNWLAPRLEAVWWADGHANLLHLHGTEALGTVSANAGIQLNGGVQNFVRGAMTADSGPYQFDRLRRFQRLGTIIDDRFLPTRLPFCDYKLLDFLQTLPESLLRGDRLYRVMLLNHFPRLFRGIPYSNTGYALDARFGRLRNLLFRAKCRFGLINYAMHDYPRWIHRQISVFQSFLDAKDTRIHDLGFREDAHRLLNLARTGNLSLPECEALSRFLSLEIYLRCLDSPDNIPHVLKQ